MKKKKMKEKEEEEKKNNNKKTVAIIAPFCGLSPPPGFLAALSFSAFRLVTAEKA